MFTFDPDPIGSVITFFVELLGLPYKTLLYAFNESKSKLMNGFLIEMIPVLFNPLSPSMHRLS
jgi:hypothetical protein